MTGTISRNQIMERKTAGMQGRGNGRGLEWVSYQVFSSLQIELGDCGDPVGGDVECYCG